MIKQLLLLIFIVTISSCAKDRSYSIKIHNLTDYNLDQVAVDGEGFDYLEIAPNSSSITYLLKWKDPFFAFAQPFINLHVTTCSDSLGEYQIHTTSGLIPYSELSEKGINNVHIELSEESPCCIFSHTLE